VIATRAEYYLPLGPSAGKTTDRGAHGSIGVLGRLKPGVTLAVARHNIDEIMQRLAIADPGPESSHRASGQYLTDGISGHIRQTLMILMGAVGLLLSIACANVASLLLVRSAARTREMAIRTAVGAGRARVARQLLTENLVLSALGGGAGILLALVCLRALLRLAPDSIPRLADIELNIPVLCFAAGATLLTGLLVGLAPVFAARKLNVSNALREGTAGSGASVRGQRLRGALVVAEIAFTLILSFASGLLIRSLIAAQNTDPGFDSRNLLALDLQLPSTYKKDDQVSEFYGRLMGELRREPGVTDAGAVTCPPGAGDCGDWWYAPLDRPAPAQQDVPLTLFMSADPGYFHAMGIRLVAGRAFQQTDRAGSPPVVVINDDLARKWWPTPQAAIGQRIKFGGPYEEGNAKEIVGVAANAAQMGLDGEAVPLMYFPFTQESTREMSVMVRTAGDPAALIPAVRRHVAGLDRNLPIRSLVPYDTQLGATLDQRRFSTLLLGIFAALAMILAGVGIYGVLNFQVSVRTREIAIRMALGAPRSRIVRWAGSHAMRLALAGIALGVLGSEGVSRWLASMVYGVSARSPLILLQAALTVVVIAIAASGVPVWRATRVAVDRNLREG
jgi:putative ABC transport system permease protein